MNKKGYLGIIVLSLTLLIIGNESYNLFQQDNNLNSKQNLSQNIILNSVNIIKSIPENLTINKRNNIMVEIEIVEIIDRGATFTVMVKDETGELHDIGFSSEIKDKPEEWMEELKTLMREKLKVKDNKQFEKFKGKKIKI